MKLPNCSICQKEFTKQRMGQVVCSPKCAIKIPKVTRQKEKALVTKRKEAIKTKGEVENDVEKVVNAYIRERDKDLPCISCGATTCYPYFHAGHFIAVGANPSIRFETENIHKQCAKCNTWGNGSYGTYRIGLIKKIGLDRVDWLEGPHPVRKYTKDDLLEIKAQYKTKLKDLKGGSHG